MNNTRLILIILHVFISIFLIYNLHPHVKTTANSFQTEKQISSIIKYISEFFCISFYHASCIVALWYSRRYAAGMIRTTGVLLIGEFLQTLSLVIQHIVERHNIPVGEIIFDVIYVCLFITSIIFTFRLAKEISNYHKDLMQLELLATTANEMSMDEKGEFSLV